MLNQQNKISVAYTRVFTYKYVQMVMQKNIILFNTLIKKFKIFP